MRMRANNMGTSIGTLRVKLKLSDYNIIMSTYLCRIILFFFFQSKLAKKYTTRIGGYHLQYIVMVRRVDAHNAHCTRQYTCIHGFG